MTRLSETTIPLRQISLDSVHEKNVRHGHISTLHIWPARRPLAASRSMLLATLLPDPGGAEERRRLGERIAGRLVPKKLKGGGEDPHLKETEGGILHWGREDGVELDRLRAQIREAFGDRAPRVLDPFAGGGAIPLEAMRLGCETFAADLNPVAWFVLRLALHYPHLVDQIEKSLPSFAIADREFATALVKSRGANTPFQVRDALAGLGHRSRGDVQLGTALVSEASTDASFAWHVRAWGLRVRNRVRRTLAERYPVYAYFEPRHRKGRGKKATGPPIPFKLRDPCLLEPDSQGRVSVEPLNRRYDGKYLEDDRNPRWVAKPVVACLWARTAECGGCRSEVPLLKTRWLCKKSGPVKRVLLTMKADSESRSVHFGIESEVPLPTGSAAQKRAQDQQLGKGTMSRTGASCPSCGAVTRMKELRAQGRSGRLDARMIAVVIDGQKGKEYRLPTDRDLAGAEVDADEIARLYAAIPFGFLDEPTPKAGMGASRAFSVDGYGLDTWGKLFTDRQLLALGTLLREIRDVREEIAEHGYPEEWREALTAYLACTLSKLADYSSSICSWHNSGEKLGHTYARFALPMVWDYCEVNPLSATTGGFMAMLDWVARYLEHALAAVTGGPVPSIAARSALARQPGTLDLVCTDPPYYDAIPYSDLMDLFYVWLRRALHGVSPEIDEVFTEPLGPKWLKADRDGELIDDASRFGGDQEASKENYEDGMARAFARCREALRDDGRLVVVFANKDPDAWETLVAALVRSGFMVTGSWPIQTEMQTRQRAMASAALASSIWLVCRKRAATRPGWESDVLGEMRENITGKLRDFWDAGIRGPDFVWSATGPALEAFSRHPVVKRGVGEGNMQVGEFLSSVRRMVVGFVVGRLLSQGGGAVGDLDELTTYYLLHRHDFGMDGAPAGAVILYALSCNFKDADLLGRHDLLVRGKAKQDGGDTSGGSDSSG
ncbi:MAG: DUF1156 domain-containing protein [Gemmatimonadota bacterium]|nr:DUF1156 domain-containing protein [Gemmatimonadota bacterium]